MPLDRQSPKRLRPLKPTTVFDPKAFLTNTGIGKTLSRYSSKQVIFGSFKIRIERFLSVTPLDSA
jgi:hypothetical protein